MVDVIDFCIMEYSGMTYLDQLYWQRNGIYVSPGYTMEHYKYTYISDLW